MNGAFTRECPACGCLLTYQDFVAYQRATRRQSRCKSCAGKVLPTKQSTGAESKLTARDVLPGFSGWLDTPLSGSIAA